MAGTLDTYQAFNAAPQGIAETESPRFGQFETHATPEAFGGQIGQAEQQAGKTGEQLGKDATEIAIIQQGKINETMSTNAETKYMSQLAKMSGDYRQKEGLDAVSGLSDYTNNVAALRQQIRGTLPEGPVQRSFDALSQRHEANAFSDANTYASTQIKHADLQSANDSAAVAVQRSGDIHVASDDARFHENIGDIKFAITRMMQTQGWGSVMSQDPQTGDVSFQDDNNGQHAKAVYQNELDKRVGPAQELRYQTLADQNVMSAYEKYKQNRDSVPGETQVKLDAWFKPKIREGAADQYMNTALSQIALEHRGAITGQKGNIPANPIDFVMQHEGGFVTNDSGKGPTNFGINQEANPDIDVKGLTKDQARDLVQTRYADAIGADKMSPALAAVAVDGAVNMGVGKTKALLDQAAGDPQKLIDLRRAEYQRLATANPARYGQYLPAWNSRLDDLQNSLSSYQATGEPGSQMTSGYQTQADYMITHKDRIIADAQNWARTNFPNDPNMENVVRERLTNTISAAVQTQAANYKQDNQTVMRAIAGDFSKGTPPTTFSELRSLPGVGAVLDRVAVQDDRFYGSIDGKIAQFAKKNTVTNSQNGYDTIMRTLEPQQDDKGNYNPNHIANQDQLDRILGRSDGTGINMKDYNDAKKTIEAPDDLKTLLSSKMTDIKNANGNVDGLGKQRALAWYNQMSDSYAKEKEKPNFDVSEFKDRLNVSGLDQHKPSRMEQISNWAKNMWSGSSGSQAAQPQTVSVIAPNGQTGTMPISNLEKALAAGYKRAQ